MEMRKPPRPGADCDGTDHHLSGEAPVTAAGLDPHRLPAGLKHGLCALAFAGGEFEPFVNWIVGSGVIDELVAMGLGEQGESNRPAVGPIGYRLTDHGRAERSRYCDMQVASWSYGNYSDSEWPSLPEAANSVSNLVKVKIELIEARNLAQPLPVRNVHKSFLSLEQAFSLQRSEHAIDVDGRKAGGVRQLFLRHGELITAIFGEARHFQPPSEFAQDMGHPRFRVTPTHIHDPFPVDRPIDKRIDPHRAAEPWMLVNQRNERL